MFQASLHNPHTEQSFVLYAVETPTPVLLSTLAFTAGVLASSDTVNLCTPTEGLIGLD